MRQNSDVHERVVAELLKAKPALWPRRYAALSEDARIRLLEGELSTLRPLVRPWRAIRTRP